MNQKLIAIDLDGTTLNTQQKISKRTIRVIKALQEAGHLVTIVTGRPYRTSFNYYQDLGLKTPMVNFNGAYCHHPQEKNWSPGYRITLPSDVVSELFRLKHNDKVKLVSAEVDDSVYTSSHYIPYPDFFPHGPGQAKYLGNQVFNQEATCVNVFTQDKYLQRKLEKEIIADYGNFVEVRTWGGFAPCLEIVSSGTQKAMGLEQVAKYYGIDRDDILAFGDENNDYEMIQYAGIGVAMNNAILPLKEIANDITPYSNDEDGLARYLEDYFNV
ncbi:Phosphatase YidA [Alloiococcus otitis]|uniref:Cof-like hydrolase n=1 Tax=Alloiococcus otitis ATCC 51267 TaxID=883081 RepID=K9EAF7_9LACT|nr:Cof-type HAD-IIB family hydrolase [Alloiococcus otitis]EKU94224.1 cof-like hydrolase [Alloiococcus otitis ATCC 51267]SUU81142.1 Phosphatase YidA [Alloiococcus otitis]